MHIEWESIEDLTAGWNFGSTCLTSYSGSPMLSTNPKVIDFFEAIRMKLLKRAEIRLREARLNSRGLKRDRREIARVMLLIAVLKGQPDHQWLLAQYRLT